MRVLLTGSAGFLGRRVRALLGEIGHDVVPCDIENSVLLGVQHRDVDVALHLAADKYARNGEENPVEVAELNIVGTANVVEATPRVVLASTCKAADPCTVYGASKLIAERIVLNAGGTVLRLVNVTHSTGSVLELWEKEEGDLPVTDCKRSWISPKDATEALVYALDLPPGRYGVNVPPPERVSALAAGYYPGRPIRPIPLRNGDRPVERLVGENETATPWDSDFVRIWDAWERSALGVHRDWIQERAPV